MLTLTLWCALNLARPILDVPLLLFCLDSIYSALTDRLLTLGWANDVYALWVVTSELLASDAMSKLCFYTLHLIFYLLDVGRHLLFLLFARLTLFFLIENRESSRVLLCVDIIL